MAILEISPKLADEKVPRAFPCTAWRGDNGERCGVTPTRRWQKTCKYGHERIIDLCGTHEGMCALSAGTCRECADRGETSLVSLSLVER